MMQRGSNFKLRMQYDVVGARINRLWRNKKEKLPWGTPGECRGVLSAFKQP